MSTTLLALLDSWMITLRGQSKSPSTRRVYGDSVRDFLKHYPELTKMNVVSWLADQSEAGAESASMRVRLQALKQFAKWLATEEGFDADHIVTVRPPRLDQKPVPAMANDEIAAMIRDCSRNTFRDKRDKALLVLFTETGLRASEMLGLQLADLRIADCTATVRRGKGGNARRVKFSAGAAVDLDRYVRARALAGFSEGPLWIGKTKPLNYQGLVETMKKRASSVGVAGFHLHRLRHSMAVRWIRSGGSETGLMAQAGWKSREMIDRYTKTAAEELAGEEFDRLSMGFDRR